MQGHHSLVIIHCGGETIASVISRVKLKIDVQGIIVDAH